MFFYDVNQINFNNYVGMLLILNFAWFGFELFVSIEHLRFLYKGHPRDTKKSRNRQVYTLSI